MNYQPPGTSRLFWGIPALQTRVRQLRSSVRQRIRDERFMKENLYKACG